MRDEVRVGGGFSIRVGIGAKCRFISGFKSGLREGVGKYISCDGRYRGLGQGVSLAPLIVER